ncbi:MAG: DUF3570 domain-containing protein [Ferruginibacter sp.]
MKRICLLVVGLYINLLGGFSQVKDSAIYKSRKLKLDEINLVSSYYSQSGNNSAVTGGIGTEKLKDYSNNFEVKFLRYNRRGRKEEFQANLGIDYYTSASSDKIDPNTISSASSEDIRTYPSVTRTVTNEKKGSSFLNNLSYSYESDYQSYGFAAGFSQKSKDRNKEFTARAQVYIDNVKIILPVEMRTAATGGLYGAPNRYQYPHKQRNTVSAAFTFAQIVNERFQLMWLLDLTYQNGYLSLPFHRVYFNSYKLTNEKLPSSRFKIPIALKANYFLGDRIILRGMYRFYKDDWGLNAHTADIETSFKLTPFFSFTPFYRYYSQTAIDYFAAYLEHQEDEPYYSSNYDYSKFQSQFFGAGFRYAPPKGLLNNKHWNMIEVRYGHYKRSNGLTSDIISLNLKYK